MSTVHGLLSVLTANVQPFNIDLNFYFLNEDKKFIYKKFFF